MEKQEMGQSTPVQKRSREQLLSDMVKILGYGQDSHTDGVNGLSALLVDESSREPDAEWAKEFAALPPPK